MKKYFYAVPLLAFGFGMIVSAHAEARSDYQVFPVHIELTKSNYAGMSAPKMLMPFNLPQSVPNGAEFVGVKGHILAITDKAVGTNGADITDSVALLEMFSSQTDYCPKLGDVVNSNLYDTTKFTSYFSQIMKQGKAGNKVLDIDYTIPQGLPLNLGSTKCMFLQFDGWEAHSKNYTIKADLEIKYKIPSSNINPNIKKVGLDIEHSMIGAPDLGYTVYPVVQGGNLAKGSLPPGTITSVFGSVGIVNIKFPEMNNWNVKSKVVVYKNGSCEKAFPKHNQFYRFVWQQNIDTTVWDDSKVIADKTVEGKGRDSALSQMTGNDKLPIHIEAGDCVAQVFVNSNIHPEYNNHGYMNEESQTSFSFIPD